MIYRKSALLPLLFLLFINISFAQPEKVMNSSEIKLALEKLNTLGSVLYIAAHPDDENTALLSYFSSGKLLRTGYLSMTRGDGGQNLIGSEQGDLLGIIRTQELLQARKIDGAEQFFTRAFDFGYSKNPQETFKFWNKNKILSDVVWVIRKFRPDIIITRFPITGEGGHGHHTASAILAEEAFHIAGTDSFANQLKYVKPWQPKRLFLNGWLPMLEQRKTDLTKLLKIDVGQYNSLLGKSYSDIAAESRSMHKSQGFGTAATHGENLQYFEERFGDSISTDLFQDIDLSWKRIPGTEEISSLLKKASEYYDPLNPGEIVPALLQAYNLMKEVKEDYWIPLKMKEVEDVIQSLLGIWCEAIADNYSGVPGETIKINNLILNRSNLEVSLRGININYKTTDSTSNILDNGKPFKKGIEYKIPVDSKYSQPYWLEKKHTNGSFNIDDQTLIGKADNDPSIQVDFIVDIEGTELNYTTPLLFRNVDPVKGESYIPFEILPPVTANFDANVLMFPDKHSKSINIHLQSNTVGIKGVLNISLAPGWIVEPEHYNFSFTKKNEEQIIPIKISPPSNQDKGMPEDPILKVSETINSKEYSYSLIRISYEHIPMQVYLPASEMKVESFSSIKRMNTIGYYMGAGDNIPEYLSELGYKVTLLSDNDLLNRELSSFDAVITGVRAYNTKSILAHANNKLLDYVSKGGNLLVQYNVSSPLVTNPGPYPITLSRDRVTDETAAITFIDQNSPLLNNPNKITEQDFDGWIQERGLYFAGSWDSRYKTVIACHDPGEKPLEGGLLYVKYGKGNFVYTSYAFFRQIPAGVPGAVRFFVNLFSQE